MKNTRAAIDAFVAEPVLALVGASRTGDKFGNRILTDLRAHGRTVYPLHPLTDLIGGVPCYAHFSSMPQRPGGVVICVPPAQAVSAVRDAAEAGIGRVWLQQGAESDYAEQLCRELGLTCVSGECILKYADPHGIHRMHRAIDDALHLGPR